MNYNQTLEYLYNSVPMFQKIGSSAYKEGLENTEALDAYLNHPHTNFKTIHVGGTNGKGSTSHTLAAILQSAGYRVGLYTSPHLVDFRERIRINGTCISEEFVVNFVQQHREFFEPLSPSFFELTTAMAFDYFAQEKVDIAVIEVGLGGRLDCTNIISPLLSIITNISNDHNQFLGDTLAKIAFEKAGIIKKETPAIIGEYVEETLPVFMEKAQQVNAPLYLAQDNLQIDFKKSHTTADGWEYYTKDYGIMRGELGGLCQIYNSNSILLAVKLLKEKGILISQENVMNGFKNVAELTGLMGRWQKLQDHPRVVCDTGHNIGGIQHITNQLKQQKYNTLRIVLGMVNDKDINGVLAILPKEATYYFTKASVARALPEHEIAQLAAKHGLKGGTFENVKSATQAALADAQEDDFIFIGGSSFIVADLLTFWK